MIKWNLSVLRNLKRHRAILRHIVAYVADAAVIRVIEVNAVAVRHTRAIVTRVELGRPKVRTVLVKVERRDYKP